MPIVRTVLASRLTAVVVVVLAFGAALLALLPSDPAPAERVSSTGLSSTVESVRAEQLREELPQSDTSAALAVYSRSDGAALSAQDQAAIAKSARSAGAAAVDGKVPPPQYSENKAVALVIVPVPEQDDDATARTVDGLRDTLRKALPEGVRVEVTGPAAFSTDLGRVFEGADVKLLAATAGVVALLLLVTYRSPGLVLVPLIVVGLAEQTTTALGGQVLARLGLPGEGEVSGIASVLVFGAATDYALLLIARYREQLRERDNALEAMRTALARTAEPILASGGTVVGALAILYLASTDTLRGIAVACAIGVLIAMISALLVLPCALVIFGRGLFWPFIPRVGQAGHEGRLWGRLGAAVARRPTAVLIASLVLLAGLAAGATGLRTGLSETEQFRVEPEAVAGAKTLGKAFPAGTTDPVIVISSAATADEVVRVARSVEGVVSVRPGPRNRELAELDVTLASEPGGPESLQAVETLRTRLDEIPNANAVVGGGVAESLDLQEADQRDRLLIMPLILLLVGAVLALLLRSLLAPVLLVLTVVASFFASLGASWLLSEHVFGFPALDGSVILLAFLFLVALGVDYNIFLTTRAREQAATEGTRDGMLTALRLTGGVITSAGLVLAAVFAVLGVLPLITLTQIGIIVCIGVLLDTLLVRTVVVPALAFKLGERFWWPGRPAERKPAEEPDRVATPSG